MIIKIQKDELINLCNKVLRRIKSERIRIKKDMIWEHFSLRLKRWERSWFKRFFKKPTLRDSVYWYYNAPYYQHTRHISTQYNFVYQENSITNMLNLLSISSDTEISLTGKDMEFLT